MAGDLEMTGGSIKTHPSIKIARYLEADIPRLNRRKTVYDEIFDSSDRTSRENVRSICGALMFSGDDALKKISVLSGGEKSRVLLGKVLTTPCNLLLLDEPTNHLDMESTEALLEAIKNFEGAVVMVTHNEWLLKNIAERLLVFKPDRVRVFEGGYSDFLRIEGWEEDPASKSKSQPVPEKKKSKREIKRIEASIRQKRFKAIGPLEKKIKSTEKKIASLEEEKVFNTNLLIEASENADAQKIKEASQNESRLNQDIEKLYTELENLLTELDEKTIVYEAELKKLEEK